MAHATWTEGGRRRQTKRTFRTKKEAQAALVQILSDRRQGTYVEPTRLRLRDYAESWLDGVANQGRKARTLRGYRRTIELYLLPHLGDVPLQELTVSDFDALYAKLLRSGGRHGTGLSLTSVHHVHAVVNKMLNDAARKGLVVRNVARLADAPTLTAARSRGPEMRVWSPSELATFLRAVEGNPWEAVFRVLAMTGLRRSEAVSLRWRSFLDVRQGSTSWWAPRWARDDYSSGNEPRSPVGLRAKRVLRSLAGKRRSEITEHGRRPL